jgi:hypothetical protein
MIVAIPIIFCGAYFSKAIRDSTMIGNREVNQTSFDQRNKSALQISLFHCRDGKEANILFYYITILVLFMAKGLEQHMLLSISKAILQVECGPLFQ